MNAAEELLTLWFTLRRAAMLQQEFAPLNTSGKATDLSASLTFYAHL